MRQQRGGLESEVQELREEVEDLRAEVRRLRRALAEVRALVAEANLGSCSGRESDSRDSADPEWRRIPSTSGTAGYSSSPDLRPADRGQSVPVQAQSAPVSGGQSARAGQQSVPADSSAGGPGPSAHTNLTWLQREEICDQIGHFLARSISGGHRGTSGRERINLPSRLWIVVRDYTGQIYTPVKVVRSWTSCRLLCKPNNYECGDSVFVGLPSEREARRVVQAAGLDWPQAIEG